MLSALTAKCFQSTAEDALWDLWQALESEAAVTAFQSSWFMKPFLEDFAPKLGAEPCIIMLFEKDGKIPVMILPFIRQRSHGQRIIAMADLELCDYCAPVLSRKIDWDRVDIEGLWEIVLASLPSCDLITLKKMPAYIDGLPNPLTRLQRMEPMGVNTALIDQAEDPFPKKTARDIRSKMRKLQHEGVFEEVVATKPQDLHLMLDQAIAQRSERCRELNIENNLGDEAVEQFYRSLIDHALPHARMVGLALKQDGSYIAISMGIVVNGAFNGLILSMGGAETRKYSPGILVIARHFNWAFEVGCKLCDLGVGGAAYKAKFGGEKLELMEYEMARSALGLAGAPLLRVRRKLRVGLQSSPKLNHQVRRLIGKI